MMDQKEIPVDMQTLILEMRAKMKAELAQRGDRPPVAQRYSRSPEFLAACKLVDSYVLDNEYIDARKRMGI